MTTLRKYNHVIIEKKDNDTGHRKDIHSCCASYM